MRRLGALGAVLVTAILAATAAASPPTKQVMKTSGPVIGLAADGGRVAIASGATGTGCDRIVVWSPAKKTNATSSFAAGTNCAGGGTSAGEFLSELALAGTRLAWVEVFQGNLQDLELKTRLLGQKKSMEVAFAENHNGAEVRADGDYLGHVYGDGPLLVFNTWSVCTAVPAGFEWNGPKCDEPAPGDAPVEVVSDQQLWKIAGPGKALIASGEQVFAAQSVANGNVATLQEDGFAVVHAAGGETAWFVAPVQGIAISDPTNVVVLRNGALEQVSTESEVPPPRPVGAPPGTTPVLTDLDGLVAVVVAGRKIFLISLDDGQTHVISVPGTGPIDAELEESGLFYSYSLVRGKKRGRVVFVPQARVADWFPSLSRAQATAFAQSP